MCDSKFVSEPTMEELVKIKKSLKVWEMKFKEKHGHKPTKDEINEAPADIKGNYMEYYRLKRKIDQENKEKPSVETWGAQLNKSNQPGGTGDQGDDGKDGTCQPSSSSFMSVLGQKLLASASFSAKKKQQKPGLSKKSVEKMGSDGDKKIDTESAEDEGSPSIQLDHPVLRMGAQLTNMTRPKSMTKHNQGNVNSTDVTGLINTATNKTKLVNMYKKFKSVEITDPFAGPVANSAGVDNGNPTGTRVNTCSNHVTNGQNLVIDEINVCNDGQVTDKKYAPIGAETANKRKQTPSNITESSQSSREKGVDDHWQDEAELYLSSLQDQSSANTKTQTENRDLAKSQDQTSSNKTQTEEPRPGEEQFLQAWDDKRVANKPRRFAHKHSVVKHGGKRKKKMQSEPQAPAPSSDPDSDEVKVTWDEPPDSDLEEMQPKKKARVSAPRKSASSMSLNENYVRLNMKVKSYRRKGQSMSGSQFKRFAWKKKMQARRDNQGDKCFKCGGEGHWAKNCTGVKPSSSSASDPGPYSEDVVDDAAYPTLLHAARMAMGVKHHPTDETTKADFDECDLEAMIVRTPCEAKVKMAAVKPLYSLREDGSLPDTPVEVMKALRLFGYSSFRSGQEKAIMRVLCGQSTLVVLSTGAGKSLCYQLPAFLYGEKLGSISLIISPLVSLMDDQVSGLPPGVRGACLHTGMSKQQRENVVGQLAAGKLHFLLMSPEGLVGGASRGALLGLSKLPPVAFACIDEAHCVSEWSHHFRPSYLRLCKVLREELGVKCMLGLTATATMATACSVAMHLGIHDYNGSTIRGRPIPENLQMSVSCDEVKDEALLNLLQGERFGQLDSIIIYCTRRDQTERLATLIRTCLKRDPETIAAAAAKAAEKVKQKKAKAPRRKVQEAECYHAGLAPAKRKSVQNAFMSGHLRIIVATVAFGMGLDKADVRGIIHYNMPKSFESYVQEIGRAGRDGEPAQCHVFLNKAEDMRELKRHIYSNTIDASTIKKLVKKVFRPCLCHHRKSNAKDCDEDPWVDGQDVVEGEVPEPATRVCVGHERAIPVETTVMELDLKEEAISTLLCYMELHPKRWVVNLQPVYSTCTLQFYAGPRHLLQTSLKCPPVAVAVALEKKQDISHSTCTKLVIPIVDISDRMGWESGLVKRELAMLQWQTGGTAGPQKSSVLVEMSDLAYHFHAAGNLTNEELDEVLGFLMERVNTQEKTELYQLQELFTTLSSMSHKHYYMCDSEVDQKRSKKLKSKILEYFERPPAFKDGKLSLLAFSRELEFTENSKIFGQEDCLYEDQVRADIRSFISLYSRDHPLHGRAIARIFHGIPSPCFPSDTWGRVRRFWRCHMNVDFNLLRRFATQELIRAR